ncbi:catalase [Lysobacter psychrotolerans]|uniref:Catalase n=1 Tax=Montanilutibacter psychrotolerans TaxID=1327343 RepID=A0A3M8SRI2_9GAMM|nr:catalase [Lysobacter psychrotolerans]
MARTPKQPPAPKAKSASRPAAAKPKAGQKRSTRSSSVAPPSQKAELDAAVDKLARRFTHNREKAGEYGRESALSPAEGAHADTPDLIAASTVSEANRGDKTGSRAGSGDSPGSASLDRVRTDAQGQRLTTNQGVAIADNQNSLKAGMRGPALLKDFILREKITHFDHERIPERIVHARGSGAHGFFEAYDSLRAITRAAPFARAGKITPVFVRFSTVAGERGSKDTARDVRGFAVKFYTDEGNWDLVGNNIPVFFIQDAMKFPDLVHAVKPEPHHAMPQAASAHDTFWDFVSLMPESTHMLMWVMSDRAIPRSYRMMQGFGVHTFRLVNEDGEATLCKFHWAPKLGTHSLTWDEAVKISGCDPDYHRRDLWEAIESGAYPEYELSVQLFSEAQAAKFSFDVLDSTKIVPEELVPLTPVGRLVLNRNPDNFFAETEQVAFCAAHVVPGIDFTNDPLLAGRIHSYVDTQLSRLGGPNFHEIPINAPVAPVQNNQRDGLHRQAIHRGRVAYEPNSLGGGCPFQAGAAGFVSFPEPVRADELRAKPEKFAEHYNQATLFYASQSPIEKAHIIAAFRFELSKVMVPAIRARVVSMLANVAPDLAAGVADGLGIKVPDAMPRAIARTPRAEVKQSPTLSLLARPGELGIQTRKIAVLVAPGVEAVSLRKVGDRLVAAGATVRLVGPRVGPIALSDGSVVEAEASLENEPSVLFDALVLPDGEAAVARLASDGRVAEYIKDQYRHCKPILVVGASRSLLEGIGASTVLADGSEDAGIVLATSKELPDAVERFVEAIAAHRHWQRETDRPLV